MIFIEPGTKSSERMMNYIPDYYQSSRIMNELMETRGIEMSKVIQSYDEILDQFFIKTATWNLSTYEKQYGLPLNESDSLEDRRKRVISKKRSGRTNLLSILQAQEPSLTLAWGRYILPFTIKTYEDDYNFKALMVLLGRYAPSHLGYSFRVEYPDNPDVGYTVYMNKKDRFRTHQELLSGTTKSGRYPKWNTRGESLHRQIDIISSQVTGIAELQRSAGIVSNGKDVPTAFGSVENESINIISERKTGSSKFNPSGSHKAGHVVSESVGSVFDSQTLISPSVATGNANMLTCGSRSSGEEVA